MDLKSSLLLIQLSILALQIGCIFYATKKNKDTYDVLAGFGIWGSVPNIAIMGVILSL